MTINNEDAVVLGILNMLGFTLAPPPPTKDITPDQRGRMSAILNTAMTCEKADDIIGCVDLVYDWHGEDDVHEYKGLHKAIHILGETCANIASLRFGMDEVARLANIMDARGFTTNEQESP